jgi:ATPase family AAA domain-containing protein 3A/B
LVRETSRFSLLEAARHPILTLKELRTKKSSALKDVILPPKLESRLGYIYLNLLLP